MSSRPLPEAQLDRRWRPALMAFFLRRVGNHSEAEDLTQEVFVRMLARAEAVDAAPDSYIFQIAVNLLQDRARRAKVRASYRERLGDPAEADLDTRDPHRILCGVAALDAFSASLADLPERTRTIFILYRMEGMGQEDIAIAFGISKSLVKQEVARAMAFVMKRMRGTR